MRKLVGSVVLVGGVGVLGYVGTTQHAERMQAAIAESTASVAQAMPHNVQTQVSGRDVRATGLVANQTELAVLQAVFESQDGVRRVDMSGVATLPLASPFALNAVRDADGMITVSGAVPSESDRGQLADVAGDAAQSLIHSAGAPDANWSGVAAQGLSALELLKSGDMELSDQTITISGLAATPQALDAALAQMADLSEGYTLNSEITVEDDGTPLRLNLTLADGVVDGTGKFPEGMLATDVTDRFAVGEDVSIIEATIPAADVTWPDMTSSGMDALAGLIEGQLVIEGRDVRLSGVGSPDAIAQAETLLAALPDDYIVTTDLNVYGADFDLRLDMNWGGTTAVAAGIYPSDFTPRGPLGDVSQDTGQTLFLSDEDGAFTANADAGVAALALLQSGALVATSDTITLTGIAASPQVGAAIDDVLASAAEGTNITRDITFLDDGSPAAWSLAYNATQGGTLEGRLPNGLDAAAVATALGFGEISGTPSIAADDDNVGSSLETLQIVSEYLPEVEAIAYSHNGDSNVLDLVLAPGVNIDLIANDLAERLPSDVSFSLGGSETLPEQGETRVNAATGLSEIFTNGFWLPTTTFIADAVECNAQSLNVFERDQIGFFSSSAQLDAKSIRAINALAAVALICVDAGLTFEVGGHTDSSGSVLANDVLSGNRANSVRAALIERGVPAEAMTSFGYGQTQPVADNQTPEGRAANRRTDITWFAAGTP